MNNKIPAEEINGKFAGKDIVSLDQFDTKSLEKLFRRTEEIIKLSRKNKERKILAGKIITLLFFEPSTRTFSSFSAAVKRLGGQTIEYQNPLQTSSSVKGESLGDTIKVVSNYSDAIVMRHPAEGSADIAAMSSPLPVVNAGDGTGEHPTQAFLDLYTIHERFNRLDHITGVFCGDFRNQRVMRSLMKAFAFYKGNTFYLLSPKELVLPRQDFKNYRKNGLNLIEIHDVKDIHKNADFWYWTRIAKERFTDYKKYEKINERFIKNMAVTKDMLNKYGNKKMILLHVLPRTREVAAEIDDDPRSIFLTTQVKNGMYTRMALLSLVLGGRT